MQARNAQSGDAPPLLRDGRKQIIAVGVGDWVHKVVAKLAFAISKGKNPIGWKPVSHKPAQFACRCRRGFLPTGLCRADQQPGDHPQVPHCCAPHDGSSHWRRGDRGTLHTLQHLLPYVPSGNTQRERGKLRNKGVATTPAALAQREAELPKRGQTPPTFPGNVHMFGPHGCYALFAALSMAKRPVRSVGMRPPF